VPDGAYQWRGNRLCVLVQSFVGTLTLVGLMLALASLDLVEAVLAKEWSIHRSPWLLVAGVVASILLFVVFVMAIGRTQMSSVTIGWVVMLQVGLMVTESVRYGVSHSIDRWIAMGAIVCLLGYLVSSPASAA
jgi:NAD/NADP transhydrogenase beta subunit